MRYFKKGHKFFKVPFLIIFLFLFSVFQRKGENENNNYGALRKGLE